MKLGIFETWFFKICASKRFMKKSLRNYVRIEYKKKFCVSKILMIELAQTKKSLRKSLELVCKKRNILKLVQAVNAKRNPSELM